MKTAPIPQNEQDRLCAVLGLKILDTATEERFDLITREATKLFGVPIATITIVDRDREWYKSVVGLEKRQGPRDISFCGHALLQEDILIIEDTLENSAFKDNPMVIGEPRIRFYAGKSLYDWEKHLPVGVFCIKDYAPRRLSDKEINDFLILASRAEEEVNRPTIE